MPSRRSTADFCPCGAASYSASTRARYSAGYVRRDGLAAGSVTESPVVGGRNSSMMVIRSPPPQWATPQPRDVSHQPDREGAVNQRGHIEIGEALQGHECLRVWVSRAQRSSGTSRKPVRGCGPPLAILCLLYTSPSPRDGL